MTRCSVPPPNRMRRFSTVLNQDGARVFICFCTARHLELRVLVFHKTLLEVWVPYFVLPDSVGLILSCNKLASDRHAPVEVPAKGTTTKLPPQTQQLSYVPFAEISHTCVVTCGMGIMYPNYCCCCRNSVSCLNNVLLLVTHPARRRESRQPLESEKGRSQLVWT